MLAFSTCWNGHRHTDGEELVNEVLLLGFEAIEVSHGTKITLFPGLKRAIESGRIRVAGGHNFCPSPVDVMIDAPDAFEITADDEDERMRAIRLSLKSIDTVASFDGNYLVLHLGSSSLKKRSSELAKLARAGKLNDRDFVRKKIDFIRAREAESPKILHRIRTALDCLLPYAEEKRVTLGLETRSHYEQAPTERELALLLEEYSSPSIGYWHDFGHAQRKANLDLIDHRETLARFADRLIGCHFHDCGWPDRDHRVPFQADIDFSDLMDLVPEKLPLVWEMSPKNRSSDIKVSVDKWKAFQASAMN